MGVRPPSFFAIVVDSFFYLGCKVTFFRRDGKTYREKDVV
jgi:hypothetical protein